MTVQCPRGHRCEACGQEHETLAVTVAQTAAGPVCVTLCPGCGSAIANGTELPITVGTAGRLAEQHRIHLSASGTKATFSASGWL